MQNVGDVLPKLLHTHCCSDHFITWNSLFFKRNSVVFLCVIFLLLQGNQEVKNQNLITQNAQRKTCISHLQMDTIATSRHQHQKLALVVAALMVRTHCNCRLLLPYQLLLFFPPKLLQHLYQHLPEFTFHHHLVPFSSSSPAFFLSMYLPRKSHRCHIKTLCLFIFGSKGWCCFESKPDPPQKYECRSLLHIVCYGK